MKKLTLIILGLLLVSSFSYAQGTTPDTQLKFGYVNSETILEQLPEAIKAQGELDAQINVWNAQLDSMETTLREQYTAFQEQAETMTEDQQLEAQNALLQMQQNYEAFRRQKFGQGTGEVYQLQDKLLAPVKQKIFDAIETIAKEEGMQFVFDKPGDILILYADEAYDITFTVLDRLKRGKK